MPGLHVKKNDMVIVLSGKDKDKKGKVLEVLPDEKKLLVEGVNVMKRHTKARPPKVPQGGILEKAQPISSSKVMLVCPRCSKVIRVKHKVTKTESGRIVKERVCRKCGETI